MLDARLRGRGDWDLVLRDTTRQPRRRLARLRRPRGRAGLDARRAHDRRRGLPARRRRRDRPRSRCGRSRPRCRRCRPARRSSSASRADAAQLAALERAGLDVTHERGRGWADVIVAGAAQQAILRLSGLRFQTRDADLAKSSPARAPPTPAYDPRVGAAGSALPSGRTTYRTYDEVQAELKQLVAQHPGPRRKVSSAPPSRAARFRAWRSRATSMPTDGRPVFFLMGEHHAREWPSVEAAMEFAQLLVQEQATPRVAACWTACAS